MVDEPKVDDPVTEVEKKPKAKRSEKKKANGKPPKRKMSQRGRKSKGSAWERNVGKQLSLWLTGGERGDLFSRNVLSGGAFTRSGTGMPGDLIAAHPLALEFVQLFAIECKNNQLASIERYMMDANNGAGSFIGKTIQAISSQAESHNLSWMVIVKQNRQPAYLLLNAVDGVYTSIAADREFPSHLLYRSVTMIALHEFTKNVKPAEFLRLVKGEEAVATDVRPAPVLTPGRRVPLVEPARRRPLVPPAGP